MRHSFEICFHRKNRNAFILRITISYWFSSTCGVCVRIWIIRAFNCLFRYSYIKLNSSDFFIFCLSYHYAWWLRMTAKSSWLIPKDKWFTTVLVTFDYSLRSTEWAGCIKSTLKVSDFYFNSNNVLEIDNFLTVCRKFVSHEIWSF